MEQPASKPKSQPVSNLQSPPSVTHRVGIVLLAAGRGERFGGEVPKQFVTLGGKPIVCHSMRTLLQFSSSAFFVVVLPDFLKLDKSIQAAMIKEWEGKNECVLSLISGGARRQDSVAAGLKKLEMNIDLALVHDAARPFPSPAAIEKLIERAMACGGGLLASRATDTIKRSVQSTDGPNVAETIDRDSIWLAQTPQAIRGDLIPRAIEELRRPGLNVTDEASLLESWGIPVALIESPQTNFKITTSEDLARAEAVLSFKDCS